MRCLIRISCSKLILQGLHNVVSFASGSFSPARVPAPDAAPLLILRPRAWNMVEQNVAVRIPFNFLHA